MLPRRRSRGYTLVEVLVAFVIMAMALTVLLRIFSGGVRNVALSSDYAKAVLIAESRLATAGIDDTLARRDTASIVNEALAHLASYHRRPAVMRACHSRARAPIASLSTVVSSRLRRSCRPATQASLT